MKPIASVDDVKKAVEAFEGDPEEFVMIISGEMQDQIGVNMAVITDCALARGWEPDGFEQHQGFRVYRYKAAD